MSTKFSAKKQKQAQVIIEVDEVVNMFRGRQEQEQEQGLAPSSGGTVKSPT